ncbi:MAG: hypothetical protein RL670_51, partial [Actinomycetota bacterium]
MPQNPAVVEPERTSAPAATSAARVKLGNRRVTGKEQYYTPSDLAAELVSLVAEAVGGLAGKTVLEPAGGTGAFIAAAEAAGASEIHSFDIEPLHGSVAKADFLTQNLSLRGAVAISNPPFGRNNSLSIPFFNKAAEYADTIAFIVPRSWRKWSVINRLDPNFRLTFDRDLQINYVDAAGKLISKKRALNTCFQIWQRSEQARGQLAVRDNGFITKTSPELADISLTIFGYGCGSVRTVFERRPNTTQMFLKLNHPKALSALKNADFERF